MSFTTAGTVTTVIQGRNQFQRLFSDIFAVTITGANPQPIAAGAEDWQLYSVPGVRKGDIVLGNSFSANVGVISDIQIVVNTDDVVAIRISNVDAALSLDITPGDIKILIGRPAF